MPRWPSERLLHAGRNWGDFLPLHVHRVVCISCVLRTREGFKVWSLALRDRAGQAAIIQRFFDGIEKFSPQLVSWNGGGFNLPCCTTAPCCMV